jgi:opacity protein-like surface antigen
MGTMLKIKNTVPLRLDSEVLMLNKKYIFAVLLLPATVFASASSGPYIGIEAGAANQIVTFTPAAFDFSTSGNSLYNSLLGLVGRLNLGYNMDQYSGFELGANYNFGANFNYPNNSGSMNITATTFDASYIFSIPTVIRKLSVFGRVGFAYDSINSSGSTECNCGNPSALLNPGGSGFADILGAGIKYNISPSTSFRVEWISNGLIFPVGVSSGSQNVANWSEQTFQLGLNYHF